MAVQHKKNFKNSLDSILPFLNVWLLAKTDRKLYLQYASYNNYDQVTQGLLFRD